MAGRRPVPPIVAKPDLAAPSVFTPEALVHAARRQKGLAAAAVPAVCVLDPDGDIVRRLRRRGLARQAAAWACYHTELWTFDDAAGRDVGVVGCAVGAPFAVLVAEQLFACGCRLLISITSAGVIEPVGRPPPYFVVIDRALRDEGTSYHYLPAADFAAADPALVAGVSAALADAGIAAWTGPSWTTDAPFRETAGAIAAARGRGILAVEMEAAALYAFAAARGRALICLAHVTNNMGQTDADFEKGEADGTADALRVIGAISCAIDP